jgi:hypothetical protein
MKLNIQLAVWNNKGTSASIVNKEGDSIQIGLKKTPGKADEVCRKAAEDLRSLADAFDRLAASENPFQEKAQKQAMRVPK